MAHNDARPSNPDQLALEAWAEGYMLGSLTIMAAITLVNMRRGVLLHKLILIELLFGTLQAVSIFFKPPAYGWYLATGGVFLNISWSMHNVIAWLKNRPFLSKRVSTIYITTVILAQPYWILEMVAAFLFFNDINDLFTHTRPWEALFRDPWWLFTTFSLFWNIKTRYEFSLFELVQTSPRLGLMLCSMLISIVFIICDILSVTHVINTGSPDGVNPFWKLAFVFKCLTDTIILDDFKTALDKLKEKNMEKLTAGLQTLEPQRTMSGRMSDDLLDKARASHREMIPSHSGCLADPENYTALNRGLCSSPPIELL
ncbi:hypothetical protein ANO11243_043760 [Dothideomycetidae sp. 11243]|nr:hypothetical protein ANO11243_043760 [fungal sp. No.11243]